MCEAILKDQRRILPTIAYLEGEYGIKAYTLVSQPSLAQTELKKSLNLNLTEEEKAALDKSVESVQNVMEVLAKKK